ncbi:MAG TPA: hypothetical protein DCM40_21960 [Maribacter sp.]|nr:hypothetical protein [Maribacter sp.]
MIFGPLLAPELLESNCKTVALSPADNVTPVSATCVRVTSLSAPNPKTAASFASLTSWLNEAVPASLPSIVKKVVSALPSVPLRIISVSLP